MDQIPVKLLPLSNSPFRLEFLWEGNQTINRDLLPVGIIESHWYALGRAVVADWWCQWCCNLTKMPLSRQLPVPERSKSPSLTFCQGHTVLPFLMCQNKSLTPNCFHPCCYAPGSAKAAFSRHVSINCVGLVTSKWQEEEKFVFPLRGHPEGF